MRRWFIAFLTLMLLTQFTWAATSKCCVSELTGHAQRAGLSAMGVAMSEANTAGHDESGQACQSGHCHCHHASVATGFDELSPAAGAVQNLPGVQRAESGESHIPEGLDRPNWLRA